MLKVPRSIVVVEEDCRAGMAYVVDAEAELGQAELWGFGLGGAS